MILICISPIASFIGMLLLWGFTTPVSWPVLTVLGFIAAAITEKLYIENAARKYGVGNFSDTNPSISVGDIVAAGATTAIGGQIIKRSSKSDWIEH